MEPGEGLRNGAPGSKGIASHLSVSGLLCLLVCLLACFCFVCFKALPDVYSGLIGK